MYGLLAYLPFDHFLMPLICVMKPSSAQYDVFSFFCYFVTHAVSTWLLIAEYTKYANTNSNEKCQFRTSKWPFIYDYFDAIEDLLTCPAITIVIIAPMLHVRFENLFDRLEAAVSLNPRSEDVNNVTYCKFNCQ